MNESKDSFCPYCGSKLSEEQKDEVTLITKKEIPADVISGCFSALIILLAGLFFIGITLCFNYPFSQI